MPFQRYLQDNRQDMFPYDFDSNAPQTNSSSSSSSSLLTAAMDMPISHAGQSNSGFSHSIRLQIPQFMQTGAPMLAPGGGAEVLPVGLFSGNPAANSAWFVNNGITSNLSCVLDTNACLINLLINSTSVTATLLQRHMYILLISSSIIRPRPLPLHHHRPLIHRPLLSSLILIVNLLPFMNPSRTHSLRQL